VKGFKDLLVYFIATDDLVMFQSSESTSSIVSGQIWITTHQLKPKKERANKKVPFRKTKLNEAKPQNEQPEQKGKDEINLASILWMHESKWPSVNCSIK